MAPRAPAAGTHTKRTGSNSPPPIDGVPVNPSSEVLAAGGAPSKHRGARSQSANVPASDAQPKASAAGGGSQAGSNCLSQKAREISAEDAQLIGAYLKVDRPPLPQEGVLLPKQQVFVNQFSTKDKLTEGNIEVILRMTRQEERNPLLRERLLFVAEVDDGRHESIFIKFVALDMSVQFLITISQGDFLKKISPLGLNHLCRSDVNLNKSLAWLLLTTSRGRDLLRDTEGLADKINAEVLNGVLGRYVLALATDLLRAKPSLAAKIDAVVLNDVKCGKSAAYWLCATENGRALLTENHGLVDKITPQGLNALLPKEFGDSAGLSPLYWLCENKNGRTLLLKNSGLVDKITSQGLNAILPKSAEDNKGKSALFFLCVDGIDILKANPELVGKITADGLNERLPMSAEHLAGKSGTYFLCGNPAGRALLRENTVLVDKITSDALNAILLMSAGVNAGLSALYFLCVDGIDILKANSKLVGKITSQCLNAILPQTAGNFGLDNTVAYVLANTEEGKLLIAGNIELAKKISRSDFDRIFRGPDGDTVEDRLERYIKDNTQVVLGDASMFAVTPTPASPSTNPPSSRP